jgi:hypothetical protein
MAWTSSICIPCISWSTARFLHPLQLQQLIDSKFHIDGELPPLTNELLLPSPSAGLHSFL